MNRLAHPPSAPVPHSRRAARWLALGDSYTIGEGVEPAARWPARLAARLSESGIDVEPPRLVATTGWTTDELLAGMEAAGAWPATERFDLVTLQIGVNDQYRGRSVAEVAPGFERCVARAVALAGGRASGVLGLSIPDWGVTRFAAGRDRPAIADAIDAFNAYERAHLSAIGAPWCDITSLSRQHGDDGAFLAGDGLHPGAAAYREWAEAALPLARAALAAAPEDGDPRGR